MQVLEEKEKVSSIYSELDKYKQSLEQLYKKTDIEDYDKEEITNLLTEIQREICLIARLISQDKILKAYGHENKVARIMIEIAACLKKLGEKEILKKVIEDCSLLTLETSIRHIKFVRHIKQINKIKEYNSILELIEYEIQLLRIDNVKQIKETIEQCGFINIDKYFSAIIDINEQLSVIKNKARKNNNGFGSRTNSKINLEKINHLDLLISNLIQTALNISRKADEDYVIILQNVTWEEYKNISETLGEVSWCKLSYSNEVLELVVTGERHETINRYIDGLIINYFDFNDMGYIPVGSATYKSKKKGKEADSAYKFTEKRKYPDLAIEINFSSGGIDSLEIYKDLETKEVWMWDKKNELKFYILEGVKYIESENSFFLKGVTPKIIKKYVQLIGKDKLKISKYKKDFITEVNSNIIESFS